MTDLAAIRKRNSEYWQTFDYEDEGHLPTAMSDRHDLLAHIDALAAKVEGLARPAYEMDDVVYRAAVLAILRGE